MSRKVILIAVLMVGFLMPGCAARQVGSLQAAGKSEITPAGEVTMPRTPFPTETLLPALTLDAETATPEATPTTAAGDIAASCGLSPLIAPTMAPYPGRNALDKTTNLHVTGNAVRVDLAGYRLKVTGLVDHPLSLSLEALRCMPKVTATPKLICPGFFEDQTTWSGVPMKYILELAGIQSGAEVITMVSTDQYESRMDIQTALKDENFLAYEWNGEPLPILHGFPLRAVFPSIIGEFWVKWLLEIRVE
jgi:DMSO/TMAO reductase YedYZ molybdopterin-dependent catalytic subunit